MRQDRKVQIVTDGRTYDLLQNSVIFTDPQTCDPLQNSIFFSSI